MSVIIIITPPPKNPNANRSDGTATAVALPDGSGSIVDANGASVGNFTAYADAIAYLEHMNRTGLGAGFAGIPD